MNALYSFSYLVEQVPLLHQLLEEDDQDIRLGSSHGPSCVPCGRKRGKREVERRVVMRLSVTTEGHCILW